MNNTAANNKPAYPSLQRRRRRSDQLSPTSPSYPRRFVDRPNRYSDAFSPVDTASATDDSSSPPLNLSLNLTLSSPVGAYDHFAPLPSAPLAGHTSTVDPQVYQRSSEDIGRPRYRISDEAARPLTSDAVDQYNALPATPSPTVRPVGNGLDSGSRPPPSPYTPYHSDYYRERRLPDPPGKLGANASSPNLRNYGFYTSGSDRSTHDEPSSAKGHVGKKSRLNLLNPMSLLARRRSSQNQKLEDVSLSINTLSVPALPDNFDPSIRGHVVHDFSAPRTRRLYSQNDVSSIDSPALRSGYGFDPNQPSDSPGPRLAPGGTPNFSHSPMFKEHFQEDRPSLQPGQTGYLHNINAFNITQDVQDPTDVPAFAKRLPAVVPQLGSEFKPATFDQEDRSLTPVGENSSTPPTPPPKSTPSPKFEVPPPAVLPKHMTSTSSRFSFQIGGSGSSAQEKLLEEKHKQHEATRKTDAADEDDDYADYDFDAEDGLEEQIPGVNADFDEDDGFGYDVPESNALEARYAAPDAQALSAVGIKPPGMQGFHFTPQSMTFSPTSPNNVSQPTPRDQEGFVIGIADGRELSPDDHPEFHNRDGVVEVEKVSDLLDGLGITTSHVRRERSQQSQRPQGQFFDDEDLYFDDGEFDHAEMDPTAVAFDEKLFDDDNGGIRDIPAENARKYEAARQSAGQDGEVKAVNHWDDGSSKQSLDTDDLRYAGSQNSRGSMDHHQNKLAHVSQGNSVAGLTETNLAAYHDALAFAANQAAANGKFDRKVSFSQASDDTSQSPFENSHHGIVSDDSHFSLQISSAIAEDDGFPFDDDLDDDPMIAEANAEALANDDEGFYGQEFGFFARSLSKGGVELVNGGYFADRGSNGIKRSHSGKANFQEPSLTPITERSEWSTRNSVVSLQIPGGIPSSAQSLPSPGIAQLLELDSPYDEDMSLSALMKLRGRTFGNSSPSVSSSVGGGHPVSSPLAHHSSHPFAHSDLVYGRIAPSRHGRSSSSVGIPESEEEDEVERPTLTHNTPRKRVAEPVAVASQEENPISPAPAGGEQRRAHHSRTSSGAESVSYARETDGRWVLERRRTDEDSGAEVIDREYLAGVRI